MKLSRTFRAGFLSLAILLMGSVAKSEEGINAVDQSSPEYILAHPGNPIITDKYTADPAAMVYDGKVYLYTGHDAAPDNRDRYEMPEWLVYSSSDMKTWEEHPVPLKPTDFSWAANDAWAAHVVEKNGKFYWYVTVSHATIHGKAIGVAVSDSPTGPFVDARGSAIVTNDMTTETKISWDDIDPCVFIDDDGAAYMFWGNTTLHYVKLKDNMIEMDGDFKKIDMPNYVEAPYVHKHGDWYYLTYSYGFPEKTVYAMSKTINGPWEFKGLLNEVAGNSNTNHQSIIEFKGVPYFIYHNGSTQTHGGSFRRSVCIDYLYYNADGTMKKIVMTTEGVAAVK